jgi:hypothetical protein
MAWKFNRGDRVILVGEELCKGSIYDQVGPDRRYDKSNYYYVQWDKGGRYLYPEEMLEFEKKGK